MNLTKKDIDNLEKPENIWQKKALSDKESMMFKVFETLNSDFRNGDFVYLKNQGRKDLDIDLISSEIEGMSHFSGKI